MAYICKSCGCVITGKVYAEQAEVNVGKIGWGWGWSQKGKLRFTSGRKLYRNKTFYFCSDCYGSNGQTHTSVSVAAVVITVIFFAYLVYLDQTKEKIIVNPTSNKSTSTNEEIRDQSVIEMNRQAEQLLHEKISNETGAEINATPAESLEKDEKPNDARKFME